MPSLTGHAPTIPGPGEVQEVFQAESGLGGTPRTQQGARGSEALSEDTSFPSRLGLGTLLSSRSLGTSSGVITDLARCPPSPGVRCPRGDGPLCLRPLCGLAVSLSRTSLGQVPPLSTWSTPRSPAGAEHLRRPRPCVPLISVRGRDVLVPLSRCGSRAGLDIASLCPCSVPLFPAVRTQAARTRPALSPPPVPPVCQPCLLFLFSCVLELGVDIG